VAIGLATMVRGAVFVLLAQWMEFSRENQPAVVQGTGRADKGTAALGDTAPPVPEATTTRPEAGQGRGLDMPRRPFPGQLIPPCKGLEVEIELTLGKKDTRNCWIKVDATAEKCKAKGYEYRGGCYLPTYPSPKVPRSIGP
jgi:hypothetical protein